MAKTKAIALKTPAADHDNLALKKKLKSKIVKACKEAGTYKGTYDMVINDLADILVMRESAIKAYKENGNTAIIQHVNISGNANIVKNPAITIIIEINQLALAYWRELGLTPKGFKALGAVAVQGGEKNPLEEFLDEIESRYREE